MDVYTRLKVIGQTLKTARKYKGLTMQETADLTGLCRQTISDVENGRGKIGLETYLMIADALGVDITAEIKPQVVRRRKRDTSIFNGLSFAVDNETTCHIQETKGVLTIKCKNGTTEYDADCDNVQSGAKGYIDNSDIFTIKYKIKTQIAKRKLQEKIQEGGYKCRQHTT